MKSRELKRIECEERNQEWRALTPIAQLAELGRRLGAGQGAGRQRKRLARVKP